MKLNRLGLRRKFLLCSFGVITVLMLVIGMFYFTTTSRALYSVAIQDAVALMAKNNQIIDQNFDMISRYANGILVDEDLARQLDQYQRAQTAYDVYALDRTLSQLLNKYFLYSNDVFSANIVTKRLTYGQINPPIIIPPQRFGGSPLCQRAIESRGRTVWIPTYDFFSMFSPDVSPPKDSPYRRVFSAVKLIRQMDGDYAVLVINFLDTLYEKVLGSQNGPLRGDYFVASRAGDVVYCSNAQAMDRLKDIGLTSLFPNDLGFSNVGDESIACYHVSGITGWITGVILPRSQLTGIYVPQIIRNLLIILLILLLIPVLVVMLISRTILRPVAALQEGMRRSGTGRFDTRVEPCGAQEFRALIRYFNLMNARIRNLIRENYEIGLMTREAQLNAYNLQLNPHFILNTLNIVNLQLLKQRQYQLSDQVVQLARMTEYVLNTSGALVPFDKDWQYTLDYIRIMGLRHKDLFDFDSRIGPDILAGTVPKFFLQPLVENAILHGFADLPYKGRLCVRASLAGDMRVFEVTDNGSGIDGATLDKIQSEGEGSVGIRNVRKRIECLYGGRGGLEIQSVPFQATVVRVRIPLEAQRPLPGQ